MADMSISVSSIAAPSSTPLVSTSNGNRSYTASFTIKITSNTYTSTRYVHYKVISNKTGSVYGSYISVAAKKTGNYTKYMDVSVSLSNFIDSTSVAEYYTVYTYISTSTSQPGSSGWINKGKSSTVTWPGATRYICHYYDSFGEYITTTSGYEFQLSILNKSTTYPRFYGWRKDSPNTSVIWTPSNKLTNSGAIEITIHFYLYLTPVRIQAKINDEWKTGNLYIKPQGKWVPALFAYIKINDEWIEIGNTT